MYRYLPSQFKNPPITVHCPVAQSYRLGRAPLNVRRPHRIDGMAIMISVSSADPTTLKPTLELETLSFLQTIWDTPGFKKI